MKDIFDPDSYTEEAMPISTALCSAINDLGNLGHNSTAVTACIEKYKAINNKFLDTLTKEQWDLYVDVEWGDMEKACTENVEYFNRGLRFGLLLAKELLGGK